MQNGMLDWQTQAKPKIVVAAAGQVAVLVLFGIGVSKSTVTGKHLLVIGAIWLFALCAWVFLAPDAIYGVKFNGRHRILAITIVYLLFFIYQFLRFGWLIPFGIGIYRLVLT